MVDSQKNMFNPSTLFGVAILRSSYPWCFTPGYYELNPSTYSGFSMNIRCRVNTYAKVQAS